MHTETLTRRSQALHRGVFTHSVHKSSSHRCGRCVYTQKLLSTDALTHKSNCTETLWHTHAFRHRSFYTQILSSELHRSFDTEKPLHRPIFHTQKLLHTENCPQKPLHREAFTHRSFYTQTPLHTEACTHGGFYTQKLLHREALHRAAFTRFKIANLLGFWCSAIMSCERVTSGVLIFCWTIILRQRVAPDFGKS